MARYYFHLKDGKAFPDADGTELTSLHDARCEAIKVLAQFMRDDPCDFWATQSLTVTVSDPSGLVLFSLDLSATTSPAVGGSRQALGGLLSGRAGNAPFDP